MRNKYIEAFEQTQIAQKSVPNFRAGDTLRIAIRIKEGDKTRIQNFEGICIARRGSGTGETCIIRKIGANSVGVERIFPIYSESLELALKSLKNNFTPCKSLVLGFCLLSIFLNFKNT